MEPKSNSYVYDRERYAESLTFVNECCVRGMQLEYVMSNQTFISNRVERGSER